MKPFFKLIFFSFFLFQIIFNQILGFCDKLNVYKKTVKPQHPCLSLILNVIHSYSKQNYLALTDKLKRLLSKIIKKYPPQNNNQKTYFTSVLLK